MTFMETRVCDVNTTTATNSNRSSGKNQRGDWGFVLYYYSFAVALLLWTKKLEVVCLFEVELASVQSAVFSPVSSTLQTLKHQQTTYTGAGPKIGSGATVELDKIPEKVPDALKSSYGTNDTFLIIFLCLAKSVGIFPLVFSQLSFKDIWVSPQIPKLNHLSK